VEAREVGVGDDAGGERAGERLAAEVVQQQLLVGGAEAEADGQPRDGRPGGPLHPPRATWPPLHRRRSTTRDPSDGTPGWASRLGGCLLDPLGGSRRIDIR
jgi:hypothetical protein